MKKLLHTWISILIIICFFFVGKIFGQIDTITKVIDNGSSIILKYRGDAMIPYSAVSVTIPKSQCKIKNYGNALYVYDNSISDKYSFNGEKTTYPLYWNMLTTPITTSTDSLQKILQGFFLHINQQVYPPFYNVISGDLTSNVLVKTKSSGKTYCAFPFISFSKSGSLVATYSRDTSHISSSAEAYSIISLDSGRTWGSENLIRKNSNNNSAGSQLKLIGDSILFVLQVENTAGTILKDSLMKSLDGITWTKPYPLLGSYFTNNIVEGNGCNYHNYTFLSSYNKTEDTCFVFRGNSLGRGFSFVSSIRMAGKSIAEPSLLVSNDTIFCFIRNITDLQIALCYSVDGITWSTPLNKFSGSSVVGAVVVKPREFLTVSRGYGNGSKTIYRRSFDNGNTFTDSVAALPVGTYDHNAYANVVSFGGGYFGCISSLGIGSYSLNPGHANIYFNFIKLDDWQGDFSGVTSFHSKLNNLNYWDYNGNFGLSSSNFLGNKDSIDLTFKTKNITRMSVLAAGNVGIGTSSPLTLLHVLGQEYIGTGAASLNVLSMNCRGTNYVHFYDPYLANSSGGIALGGSATLTAVPSTPVMFWNVNLGRVGIGTSSPGSKLEVNGDIDLNTGNLFLHGGSTKSIYFDSGFSNYITATTSTATSDMQFFNHSSERLRITSTGKVGINTTNPTSMLQVVGLNGYANDAAAGVAGLTTGAFYYITGTYVLMVKQ